MRREIKKMMFKTRLTMVVLCGALAFSAVAASSAWAGWFIEGEELPTGSKAALASTAKVDEVSTLLVPALGLSLLCSGSTLDGLLPEIVGVNSLKAAALTFLACSTTKPTSGCALQKSKQSIATVAIKATLQEATHPEDRLVFTPQTKTTLANIEFSEINECAFNGIEPVTGALTLSAPTLEEELATQPITGLGSTENNSLQIDGDKAFLDGGRVLLGLSSGKKLDDVPAPNIGLAVAGEPAATELNFKNAALNSIKEIEVKNVGTAVMEIAEPKLKEEGGVAEGTNFVRVAPPNHGTEACTDPQEINRGDQCFVGVKLLAKNKKATFEIKWGSRTRANKTGTFPIKSE